MNLLAVLCVHGAIVDIFWDKTTASRDMHGHYAFDTNNIYWIGIAIYFKIKMTHGGSGK
jgi:hypothetical protein